MAIYIIEEGARNMNAPKPLGEILTDILHSDSPLAEGYRKWQAENSNKPTNADDYGREQ